MFRRIASKVVAVALTSLVVVPSLAEADPPTSIVCLIPIEKGEPAFPNRIELDLASYGGMHGAIVYCLDVLGGHPANSAKADR